MQDIELLKWICDDLHIDSEIGRLNGLNKTYNHIFCPRGAGKSTLLWKMVYNTFKYEGNPSLIYRRYQTDISSLYIEDCEKIISKFTNNPAFKFKYSKSQLKEGGVMDLKINGKVFCRLVALNTPVNRLKGGVLTPCGHYAFFDEAYVDPGRGEKYLKTNEMETIKEVSVTYNRWSDKPIKTYFLGNPYSRFNPFFSFHKVNTNLLNPGSLISGDDWAVWCYTLKPELKESIIKQNPQYKDDDYARFALEGITIRDDNIRILTKQPLGFYLKYVMKLHGKCIAIYSGMASYDDGKLFYWCDLIEPSILSKRRDIICFDFGDMATRSVLHNNNGNKSYWYLTESIRNRWIAYSSAEPCYLLQEIYASL